MPWKPKQLELIKKSLKSYSSTKRRKANMWFFKTGPGEYGEGDKFIGVAVGDIRKVAKQNIHLSLKQTEHLLKSPIHEERLCALFIYVQKFNKAETTEDQQSIYTSYMSHKKYINNWDLVDSSADKIVGAFLFKRSKSILYLLSQSQNLWDRRIAIFSTYYFIRQNKFTDTLKIADLLINDEEDLIHKATGWMLREVGKRDTKRLERFLKSRYKKMPRTMLRYTIEYMKEPKRKKYLKGLI